MTEVWEKLDYAILLHFDKLSLLVIFKIRQSEGGKGGEKACNMLIYFLSVWMLRKKEVNREGN